MRFLLSIHEKHNVHQDILKKIDTAFKKTPNLAATLHGQRKIFQGCYGRRTALFPSTKCRGNVAVESRLELAHAINLERNQEVKEFRTQAILIPLSASSYCIPDFLIQTINNTYEIHEIKPSISHLSKEVMNRFDQIAEILSTIDITFKLIDQHGLPSLIEQQQLIYWYQRGHSREWSQFEISLAISILANETFIEIGKIYIRLKAEGLEPTLADYLLFHGLITLSTQSKVQLTGLV